MKNVEEVTLKATCPECGHTGDMKAFVFKNQGRDGKETFTAVTCPNCAAEWRLERQLSQEAQMASAMAQEVPASV